MENQNILQKRIKAFKFVVNLYGFTFRLNKILYAILFEYTRTITDFIIYYKNKSTILYILNDRTFRENLFLIFQKKFKICSHLHCVEL